MKAILVACLAMLLLGCTTIKNTSDVTAFKALIGEKTLIRDALICEISDKGWFERYLPKNKIYENHGFKSCQNGRNVAFLKKGQLINISEASHRSNFGLVSYSDHWYLIGSTGLDDKSVQFYLYLGLSTDGQLPNDYKDKLLWVN